MGPIPSAETQEEIDRHEAEGFERYGRASGPMGVKLHFLMHNDGRKVIIVEDKDWDFPEVYALQ